jgi:hypothetical protein
MYSTNIRCNSNGLLGAAITNCNEIGVEWFRSLWRSVQRSNNRVTSHLIQFWIIGNIWRFSMSNQAPSRLFLQVWRIGLCNNDSIQFLYMSAHSLNFVEDEKCSAVCRTHSSGYEQTSWANHANFHSSIPITIFRKRVGVYEIFIVLSNPEMTYYKGGMCGRTMELQTLI